MSATTIKARAARLREAAATRRSAWLDSLVGTTQPVLIENNAKGHSDAFAPVTIAGTESRRHRARRASPPATATS